MWLVVAGIGILVAVGGFIAICCDADFSGSIALGCGVILFILAVVAILFCLDGVIQNRYIDEKIQMYEEENAKIEAQIANIVEQYQKHESSIFDNVPSGREDSMILVSLYPELKSDALVQQQIELYSENNQIIKELREQKIANKACAWWLYFG